MSPVKSLLLHARAAREALARLTPAQRRRLASAVLELMGAGLELAPESPAAPVDAPSTGRRVDKPSTDNGDAIRARVAAGESVADVAASLNISARRVYQVMGPTRSRPSLTQAERERILTLVAAGIDQREIARRLGVNRKTVARIAPPSAVRGPRGQLKPEDVKYILDRHAAGRESGTIARELQIPTSTVSDIIRRKAGQRA